MIRLPPPRSAHLSLVVAIAGIGLLCAAGAARANTRRPLVFAVVVGHNDGWGVLPQLRFADDDALRFYKLAVRLAPRKHVALLTELDVQTWRRLQHSGAPPPPYLPPTKTKLKQVIELFKHQIALARKRDPRRPVHLYFFFSGHGEKGYFLLKRKGKKKAADAAFTGRDLRRAFSNSKATLNGLFIDACKSQSLFVAKGPEDAELGPDFSGLIKKVERAANKLPIGVLTSTVSNRPAGEARDIGGGYFSHVLISGLSGAADANSDGVVRYGELAAFVSFHTRRISGQQPWFRPPRGKLQTPLVQLSRRRDLVELSPGFGGHFVVFDAKSGALRLEVHKTDAQWTRLILEPGDYRVVWVRSRSFGLMAKVRLRNRPARLMRRDFSRQVALGSYRMSKGELAGGPSSRPTVQRSIAAFDPGQSGFVQPFTPQIVATMAVAYSSGLSATTPVFSRRRSGEGGDRPARNALNLGYGYLAPPASPARFGHGVSFGYQRHFAFDDHHGVVVGGRLMYGFSGHEIADSPGLSYQIHRVIVQAEAAYRLSLGSRLAMSFGLYSGWQLVLVTREEWIGLEPNSHLGTVVFGDPLGFRSGLYASGAVRVAGPLWLQAQLALGLEVVRQQEDGVAVAEVFWRPTVLGGVAYAF